MLKQDVDFKCVDQSGRPLPVCYGIGRENHALFQRLQSLMNRMSMPIDKKLSSGTFVRTPGFRRLAVDGFVGPATVDALESAMRIWDVFTPTRSRTIDALFDEMEESQRPLTKERVAEVAPELVADFEREIDLIEMKMENEGIRPARGSVVTRAKTATAAAGQPQPASAPRPQPAKTPVGVWIAAGIGGVALIAALRSKTKRRQSRQR